jgi:uncharacterized protein YraI
MRHALLPIAAGLLAAVTATGASAATSVTSASLNLRTGPATGYPAITVVPARQAVTVYGCTAGPGWCDIGWAGYRGWIAASYLGPIGAYPVLVYDPVVYHNAYYVGQPYYGIGPGLSPRAEARRDARIGYRVDRRMDRRWERWGHD